MTGLDEIITRRTNSLAWTKAKRDYLNSQIEEQTKELDYFLEKKEQQKAVSLFVCLPVEGGKKN